MAEISKGIVITTSEHTKDYLLPLLHSIKDTKYSVLVVSNGGYEPKINFNDVYLYVNNWNGFDLGGIIRGKEYFDEFIHLMDSCIIKDISLFDKLFNIDGTVFLTNGGYHYMGKFVSKLLPEIPKISTKQEAIDFELHWLKKPYTYFEPDLSVHTDIFEEKYGQRRMRLENDYLIKWKGTWSL